MAAARRRDVACRVVALTALAALVMALGACSDDDDDAGAPAGSSSGSAATSVPTVPTGGAAPTTTAPAPARPAGCVVVDSGAPELAALSGRDVSLAIPLGIPVTVTTDDAESAVRTAVEGGCGFVVAYGGRLEAALRAVAAGAPAVGFVLVDAGSRASLASTAPDQPPAGAPTTADDLAVTNVRVLDVRLDQAAFLAGFLAADTSTSHTVAVTGAPAGGTADGSVPAVLAAAFRAGARYRDGLRGASTTVVDAPDPSADVVFALDGRSVEELARGGAKVVTLDGDACARTPAVCPSFLTGLVADVGPALQEAAELAGAGRFRGGTEAVSVASGGVRLAPVPPEAAVSQGALLEVAMATAGVVRGEVRVSPRDVP
jgi:basic membrane lipoprotein Med (substrate-binding protein (PBP1-ABC) superfamily)